MTTKSLAIWSFVAAAVLPMAALAARPKRRAHAAGYAVVHGWPMVPEGETLGPVVSGVGADSRGNVFVFHRAGREWPAAGELDLKPISRPTILEFQGRTGSVLSGWGSNLFAMPHGLTVDRDDSIWVTDVALHQVFKFSRTGRLLLTLGERGVPGNDPTHFNRPTKVAVAADGSFYVADGYGNSRVVKFSRDGAFLLQWGTKGTGPGQFDLPHGIALDRHGRVYVADRGNARIQIFDEAGKYLSEWKGEGFGRPFDVAVGPDETVFVADGGDLPENPPDRSAVVVVHPNGSVVERFGSFGAYDGQFYRAHDIAVGKDGAVYVGDATGRVQKFVRGSKK
jgi:peptidylamidoglycolate lyase